MPWYDIVNSNEAIGASGNLYVTAGPDLKKYFPKDWPKLQEAIAYTMKYYTRMGWDCVDITWGDQSSHNYGWFPGIAINRKDFYGTERALLELIHEPMHNMGDGFLWLGLGHEHINSIAGVENNNNVYWRLIEFFHAAKLANGKSLWEAMLDAAGPRPQPPAH